jgi:hypothetical protein
LCSLGALKKLEHLAHQSRPITVDTSCRPSLTKVLTGEAGRDQVHVGKLLQVSDVVDERDVREVSGKYSLGGFIDLTEQLRPVSSLVQTNLDTADTRKQANDAQRGMERRFLLPFFTY